MPVSNLQQCRLDRLLSPIGRGNERRLLHLAWHVAKMAPSDKQFWPSGSITPRNMVREVMWGVGDWHIGVVIARKSGLESVDDSTSV